MAKRRTHPTSPRTKQVLIRLTPDEYLRRSIDAKRAGLSVSGLCEKLVCEGKVDTAPGHRPMDPVVFAELRRIGNNANQIAHALNSNLPPDVQFAWRSARDLLQLLAHYELQQQQGTAERSRQMQTAPDPALVDKLAQALRTRMPAHDTPASQTRDVFQRSVQIHPPRPRQGHE